MIIFIPTSKKELKKDEKAFKFWGSTWFKSFLVLYIPTLLILPVVFVILGDEYIESLIGTVIFLTIPISVLTFAFSTIWMLVKFRK
jgi:hypothetical protein